MKTYKLTSLKTNKIASIKSNNPQDAIKKLFNRYDLIIQVVNFNSRDKANIKVELLDGKIKSTSYYCVTKPNSDPVLNTRPNVIEQNEMAEVHRLLRNKTIEIYHGTKDPNMKPDFNYNNNENDYGKGFYTTPYIELAKEWSYASYTQGNKGYVYKYTIDISELKIVDLTRHDSLYWLAELLTYRKINTEGKEVLYDKIETFRSKYKLDTSTCDIIIGYRADDSYFRYAEDFVSGSIYKDTFDSALRNGNLGIQVFIKSEKAFDMLRQVGNCEEVPLRYKDEFIKRDRAAREKYNRQKQNNAISREKRTIDYYL